jgi:hypothetical protein
LSPTIERMWALTLHRPWPWAIFNGGKPVENRTWRLPSKVMGKVVAIHAGSGFNVRAMVAMAQGDYGPKARAVPLKSDHPTGIIGVVQFVGCVKMGSGITPIERDWYPWFCGPFGWAIANAVELREPIPCKGALGFWRMPARLSAEVRKQLGVAA